MHCSLVNNSYQQASKVLFTFVPNKKFCQLITVSHHLLTILKTTNTEFQSIQVWFTDQNNRPLEIEDSVNIVVLLGKTLQEIMRYSTEPKHRKYVQGYCFSSFATKFGDKYGKKLMDTATKKEIDAPKAVSKGVVQKTAKATGDLIRNKIVDKITSLDKTKSKQKEDERQEDQIRFM